MRLYRVARAFATAALFVAACATAHATLLSHTYVSSTGSSSNDGSRLSPFATFAWAFSHTAAGGEIDVLDSGDYGPLTITNAITISGVGTNATMQVAPDSYGIIVNAGPNDNVVLRNLTFNGGPSFGSEAYGAIYDEGAGLVSIEDCNFNGVFNYGVIVGLSANGVAVIKNSTFACVDGGLDVYTSSGSANVSLINVSFEHLDNGITADAGAIVDVSDSHLLKIANSALYAAGGGQINAERCMLIGNTYAVSSNSGSHIRLSDCDLFNNNTAIYGGAGIVLSSGDNKAGANASLGAPQGKMTEL